MESDYSCPLCLMPPGSRVTSHVANTLILIELRPWPDKTCRLKARPWSAISICNMDEVNSTAPEIPTENLMIEACGLSKFYGEFAAIRNVTFSIPRGQVAAFLGPNGAGKSTTLKILTGYLTPSEGSARIAGLDVFGHRVEAAARLGYLPENGPLYPEMTPLELLRFFGEARGLSRKRLQGCILAVVEQCSLQAVLEKPIHKLSKGYRQRVEWRKFSFMNRTS